MVMLQQHGYVFTASDATYLLAKGEGSWCGLTLTHLPEPAPRSTKRAVLPDSGLAAFMTASTCSMLLLLSEPEMPVVPASPPNLVCKADGQHNDGMIY